jgi:hypothetical protein
MYCASVGCIRPFRTPIRTMRRILIPSVTCALLVSVALACGTNGDSTGSADSIALSIESQDNIVSEDGVLELIAGTLSIQSVALIGAEGNVPLIGPVSIDLAVSEHELPLRSDIPPGSYTGLQIELAPSANGAEMLDVQVQLQTGQESTRATSQLMMSRNNDFPEGARTIAADSNVELHVLLRGMFFYLAPVSDAVDGHYEAGENHRDFLTMDLIGMFDLRVLP